MSNHRSALKIVQVVGYQNSGKTSLVSRMTEHFTARGLRVGVIKHHGHDSPLEIPLKDSHRHAEAGAKISSVIGKEGVLIEWREVDSFRLLVDWYTHHVDLLLIEGYKQKTYPKLVVVREGQSPPDNLTNVLAVGDAFQDQWRLINTVERWIEHEMVSSE